MAASTYPQVQVQVQVQVLWSQVQVPVQVLWNSTWVLLEYKYKYQVLHLWCMLRWSSTDS